MKTALLLIAHGSREPDANADLCALADELRRPGEFAIVEASYLEIAEPTIETAGRRCVEQGAECVIMVPYFLSAGVHVKRDLLRHREELALQYANVDVRLAQPLGRHPLLREIVLQRAKEV